MYACMYVCMYIMYVFSKVTNFLTTIYIHESVKGSGTEIKNTILRVNLFKATVKINKASASLC